MEKKDVDKRGGNKRVNYARAFGFFLVTREGRGGGGEEGAGALSNHFPIIETTFYVDWSTPLF